VEEGTPRNQPKFLKHDTLGNIEIMEIGFQFTAYNNIIFNGFKDKDLLNAFEAVLLIIEIVPK
jgi:hypothetical protein